MHINTCSVSRRSLRSRSGARLFRLGLIAAALAVGGGTQAQDWSLSGFGTLGGAVSDQAYNYQRFINNDGTFKRDSVLGAQIDAKLSSEWSATLQGKIAPSPDDDSAWKASVAWAFVSWRPNNEWLVRAGKVRLPLYLFSENLDVGQSYDFARMPTEMYSISPTTDITGLYVTHNWAMPTGDLSLDVYTGHAPSVVQRIPTRDAGVLFEDVRTDVTGAVLTWRGEDTTWRAGLHHAESKFKNGTTAPSSLQYTSFGPAGGYYQPASSTDHFANDIITVGLDMNLSPQWRVIGEFERNIQHDVALGANTVGGYLSVLRKFDRFTPYVTVSKLKSVGAPAQNYEALGQAGVSSFIPGADQINASQRLLQDSIPYYDQESLSLGMSYTLTPQSKLKAEFMHTWIGNGSAMIDSPAGGPPVSHQGINVLSFSYNFAF